jgi:hypothetical protein
MNLGLQMNNEITLEKTVLIESIISCYSKFHGGEDCFHTVDSKHEVVASVNSEDHNILIESYNEFIDRFINNR